MSKVQLVKNSSQSLEERGLLRSCIMIPIVTLITIISAQLREARPHQNDPPLFGLFLEILPFWRGRASIISSKILEDDWLSLCAKRSNPNAMCIASRGGGGVSAALGTFCLGGGWGTQERIQQLDEKLGPRGLLFL